MAATRTNLPEGLRDVIGKRLSRLRPATNQLLSAAAVIGREFRLDVLPIIASRSEDELDSAVEEAVAAAVIEERPALGSSASYRFTHALFRQALYAELIAPRRIRLHQQVGRALERVYVWRPASTPPNSLNISPSRRTPLSSPSRPMLFLSTVGRLRK
ncbi:MAG TPA: hypothetical protein VKV73_32165 [Chloroflexota bacterium]|nr:hypothetical protein [Chloroflexota bacterium]